MIDVKDPIIADDWQVLRLRLEDQHSIEGGPMLTTKGTCAHRV